MPHHAGAVPGTARGPGDAGRAPGSPPPSPGRCPPRTVPGTPDPAARPADEPLRGPGGPPLGAGQSGAVTGGVAARPVAVVLDPTPPLCLPFSGQEPWTQAPTPGPSAPLVLRVRDCIHSPVNAGGGGPWDVQASPGGADQARWPSSSTWAPIFPQGAAGDSPLAGRVK